MYYHILEKRGNYKGFCDYDGIYFSELTKEKLEERTTGCPYYKERPKDTGIK